MVAAELILTMHITYKGINGLSVSLKLHAYRARGAYITSSQTPCTLSHSGTSAGTSKVNVNLKDGNWRTAEYLYNLAYKLMEDTADAIAVVGVEVQ